MSTTQYNTSDSEDDVPLSIRNKKMSKYKTSVCFNNEQPERKKQKLNDSSANSSFIQEQRSTHDFLPDEVWLQIMHWLPPHSILSFGSTCHRYLYLSHDPDLWKSMKLDWQAIKTQENNKIKSVDLMMKRASKLETLVINNRTFEQVKSNVIVNVTKKACSSMKTLILSPEVVLSNSAVSRMASLTSLTHLELAGDWLKKGAAEAIASLKLLESLKLPGAEQLSSFDLVLIFTSLHALKVVDLSGAKKGTTDSTISALSKNNPGLEYVALDECERVTGKGIKAIAEHCHALKHLSLDGCYQVNDPSIVKIAGSCPHLKYLSLGLCTTVKDSSLKALTNNCHDLEYLNLFGCAYLSERGIAVVVKILGNMCLRYLCIRGIIGISQSFSEKITKEWPKMEIVHHFLPRPQRDRSKKF